MEQYLIKTAPPTVYYIADFVSVQEETDILENVYNAPKPKWTYLNNRRLQNWGGLVGKKALISDGPLPKFLDDVVDKISALPDLFDACHRPNHVLINEYQPNQGILPHVDGPAFTPIITTVSLQSHTVLDFYRTITEQQTTDFDYCNRYVGSMYLAPRSLLIVRDSMYTMYMHGIKDSAQDTLDSGSLFNWGVIGRKEGESVQRQTRVSLTIRNVPKVSKMDLMKLIGK